MGGGRWSTDTYITNSTLRAAAGKTAFDYSDTMATRPAEERVVHETLNPLDAIREARDSDDFPDASVPVAVLFDVTASMAHVPRIFQETLPSLVEDLQLKGLVEGAQIMVGAFGDANFDPAPLQVGQFEADNRIEDHLGNIWLTRGGGGNDGESYDLALYFAARRIVTDAWEKRGKKGHLIITGDEPCFKQISAAQVSRIIGDTLQDDIPIEDIITEVKERWHLTFVIPEETAHGRTPRLRTFWEGIVGPESVVMLPNAKDLADVIAKRVGAVEDSAAATP